MKDNEYLYGKDVEVPEIPEDIVMRRIELLSNHIHELLDHSYYTRDNAKVSAAIKARDFWLHINQSGI